uniref:NADH:ubiquinone reductase (H(+)-translocating) n=1 Tax=Brugia timori TaxID=42155 RepID=A0A0R3RBK2_9BILA
LFILRLNNQYIEEDFNVNRFILLVLIFVFSIIILIISPNLIRILLDGLGLVSYCLVIYFQNVKSYNAGMLTALSNRIGDSSDSFFFLTTCGNSCSYTCFCFSSFFYFSNSWKNTGLGQFLLLISGLTIFIAGLGANFEFDLKKIIALSTLRQLGLIIRFYKLAFFHLLTHALFKALLFICAGVIIHNTKNAQDIRFIGGLRIRIPL